MDSSGVATAYVIIIITDLSSYYVLGIFSLCPHKNCRRQVLLLLPFCWYVEEPQSLILVSLYPWSTVFSLCHTAHSNVKGKAERKMSIFLSHTLFHARISCARQGTASISIFRRFYLDKSSNESCLPVEMVPSNHLFTILSQDFSQRVIHKLSLFGTPC